jgi:Viral BACON domain
MRARQKAISYQIYPTDPNCIYALSDSGPINFDMNGGSGSIAVISANGTNCTWTATSDSAWLSITSGSVYTGSQTVSYTVSGNCGTNQTGTLTIAGQPVVVNQAGFAISKSSVGRSDLRLSSAHARRAPWDWKSGPAKVHYL